MTADRIGFLLARAHGLVRHRVEAALAHSGLHPGHVAILGLLADGEGRTQKALGAATGIEKSSVVLFVDFLEQEGWVERRPDPDDRRARIVTLTASGRRRLARLAPALIAARKEALAALSPHQQGRLAALLQKLVG
jgi:DNA-binding MarR family transcriptional regulator